MKKTVTVMFVMMALGLAVYANGVEKKAAKNATYSKDVAPILFAKCAECHRDGAIAPFSVLNYKETRPWAKSIRDKVVSGEMPPWHADPNHGAFQNDRRLTPGEIATITAWVAAGAPEGNPKAMPAAPKFFAGWAIGKPDQTFAIPEQNVPAEGVVAYQYLTVPTNFKQDMWITAAEIRSTAAAAVHHVIVFVREPGQSGNTGGRLLVGTAPGEQPALYQKGMGKKVPAGSDLVFQMHYTPNGKAHKDVTTIGLVYAKEPVQHEIITRPVLNMRLAIPAGADNHEVTSSWTLPEETRVVSLMPHMHLRGKDFKFTAVYPDGTSKVLLSVPKYDFNWQTYYVLKEAVTLPKGARIDCVAHFDNSKANKHNPDPTKVVKWGDQTWEEMMIGWVSYYNGTVAQAPAKPAASASGGQ
ncbi:MAG: thiol-disulfide isomerase [Blastocatellia bacterium]